MAANSNSNSQHLPNFKGMNYHIWSLKMKTLFSSQELWDLVDSGFVDPNESHAQRLREKRKKDSKTLFLIEQALHDDIFSSRDSHKAWEIL
ncbi:hypothetical protein KY289_001616 [Solanum tuberosum]|nr:hypothetical protein KY289_001616 [Solanum tuberosum]